jgi:hypothetical protein
MTMTRKKSLFVAAMLVMTVMTGCEVQPTSDTIQRRQQETMLKEATAQTGMPNIVNFRERKILKDILELRDQDGLATFTYLYNEMTGKLVFLGESVGYGIPYATQYTNPEKFEWFRGGGGYTIPQADPNGLFSPASADGTWVLMKNPNGTDVKPVFIEPRIIVSPFKLNVDGGAAEKK